ncbi:MAG: hypothetical protein ACLRMZ_23130 [Blautia marasmi]
MQGFPAPVLLQSECKEKRNDSVGLRIPALTVESVPRPSKIPSPKAVLHGFLPATVRVLNRYRKSKGAEEMKKIVEIKI